MSFSLQTRRASRALFLAVLLSGAGVVRAQTSMSPAVDEVARRAASAFVRPGDQIQLQFMRERELNSAVTVNERGEAVFPKLGNMQLNTVTIGGLRDSLRLKYSQYLRNPELEVSVLRRVVVNGEVKLPNVYLLDVASGVRDAIARAGGVLETGKKSDVSIVRNGQHFRVKNWEREQSPDTDLQSGDEIIVGRKSWLELNALSVISTSVIVIGLIRSLKS